MGCGVVVLVVVAARVIAGVVLTHCHRVVAASRDVQDAASATALFLLMAAAFGALVGQTAAALVLFFVAPTAWSLAGTALFGDRAEWLDVFSAVGNLGMLRLDGSGPQMAVAVGVWVVVPLVLGVLRCLRREVV